MDLNLLEKKIRADIIYNYLKQSGLPLECICFTSGNSSKFLKEKGLYVLSYGKNETHQPTHWFSFSEIQKKFQMFDATSSHLPFPLMNEIALELRKKLKNHFKKNKKYPIKIGSGETIICLKMAFPEINFIPYRIKGYAPTSYCKHSPLNNLVFAIFKTLAINQHKLQDK